MSSQTIAFHTAAKKVAATAAANEIWPVAEVAALFELPFNDLMWRAQQVQRARPWRRYVQTAVKGRRAGSRGGSPAGGLRYQGRPRNAAGAEARWRRLRRRRCRLGRPWAR